MVEHTKSLLQPVYNLFYVSSRFHVASLRLVFLPFLAFGSLRRVSIEQCWIQQTVARQTV